MPESYSEKEGVVLVLVLECQRALRTTRSRRSRPPRGWIGIGLLDKKEKKESTLAWICFCTQAATV